MTQFDAKFNAKFNDGKDESALRTIGEVSGALGIKPHVLRYWEQQFAALEPLKRSGGRRYYRPADIAMLEAIDRLVNEQGYTIKGANAVLNAQGTKAAASDYGVEARDPGETASTDEPEQVLTPRVEETIARLKDIRGKLARAVAD